MAERDGDIVENILRNFANPLFMRAACIGVDQANGDCFDALILQAGQRRTHISLIQRTDFAACRVNSAFDGDGIFERGKRCWFGPDDPGSQPAGHKAARNLHDVAIAFGRDQADACAFAFQNGIGRDCCAVQEELNIRRRNPSLIADRGDAGQNAF